MKLKNMFRKILIISILLLVEVSVIAQVEKLRVAVFDPTSSSVSVDEGTRDAVRELISSTFVNTGRYIIVERSLLQQVMKEQKMSNMDAFDESQATELGRLIGANKVILSVISLVGGRNMLSIKMIDVKTATIDQQKTKIVSTNDLLDIVEPLSLDLLGISVPNFELQNRQSSSSQNVNDNAAQGAAQAKRVSESQSAIARGVQKIAENFNRQNKPPSSSQNVNDNISQGTIQARIPDGQTPIARGVMELVNLGLGTKMNRYRTDEERFSKVGSGGKIEALIKFSAKLVVAPPPTENNQILFFCPGNNGKSKNDRVFLFIDGKMITATTVLNGFAAIVPDDGSLHLITVWRNSSQIYSRTVNFSLKNKYTFVWIDKTIQLQ